MGGARTRRWPGDRSWVPASAVGLTAVLLAVVPGPLLPLARGFAALCDRYPALAVLTRHVPPLPRALLLVLAALGLLNGGRTAAVGLLATVRFDRRVDAHARALPPRPERAPAMLGLGGRLAYLAQPEPLACCHGLLRPRVAVTGGLVGRLDDGELVAVLAHEREHLRRRDPLRYLALDALAAGAFVVPVAAALKDRLATRIGLAADEAAHAEASRGALAGALLAVLADPSRRAPGTAGLSATEARVARLAGRPGEPKIPTGAVAASLGLAAAVALSGLGLAATADLVRMTGPFCPWGS